MIPMKDGKVIAPFDRVRDVNVITTIVHPQSVQGLGNMVILNKAAAAKLATNAPAAQSDNTPVKDDKAHASGGTTDKPNNTTPAPTPASDRSFSDELTNDDRMNGLLSRKVDQATGALYREYKNLDAVETDYDSNTAVYKKAAAYFAQDNHSDRVAVLDYVDGKLEDSLKDFWNFNWTFAIFADNSIGDETILASNIFEANEDHFLVLQTDDLGKFNLYYGQNYTIGLKHSLAEPMDAAFVGAIANLPVGPTTWKFKTLKGITADNVTTQERSGIDNAHAIAYIISDGLPETSEGFTMSGEFIDILHGKIWTTARISNDLVDLLHKMSKIPYDNSGIGMVKSSVEASLLAARDQGIIANTNTGKGDYTVTATDRDAQSKDDLSKRHYAGITFSYRPTSAIHTITINGVVRSDTILS